VLRSRRNALILRSNQVLLISFLFIFLLLAAKGYGQLSFSAVVTRIIDGDSIVVKCDKKYIEIRLYGIDSPEWKQHSSGMSRKYIKELIYKKEITVLPQYHDSYGRLVALIEHDGRNVNGDLVRAGAAWVYPKYCKKKVCREWNKRQTKAESEGLGLWFEKDPLPPWQWRRVQHR